MAQLKGAFDDAVSGQGRMVMLAGEPGIGKTRIAQELSSFAESQGAKVFWGWCYEDEGAPPLRRYQYPTPAVTSTPPPVASPIGVSLKRESPLDRGGLLSSLAPGKKRALPTISENAPLS